jgi:hypothetical protein
MARFGQRWVRLGTAFAVGLTLASAAGCGTRTLQAGDPSASPPVGAPGTATPHPTAASSATEITEYSVISNGQLLLPGGARIKLGQLKGHAYRAAETVDGWLVSERVDAEHESLWLVRPNHSVRRLVRNANGGIAVAPDGRRFAWRDGDILRTGHLTLTGTVARDRSTAAPKRGAPFLYTGDAVVLGYSETGGGGYDNLDVWLPARGGYVPSWHSTEHVVVVFGPAPDGHSLIGLVLRKAADKSTCLATLDPMAHLKATRTACLPVFLTDYFGKVSPNGRWLAVGASVPDGALQTAVIDLRRVFDHPAVATTWASEPGGDWLDDRTFLAAEGPAPMRLTRFTVGRGAGELVTLRGLSPDEAPNIVHPYS